MLRIRVYLSFYAGFQVQTRTPSRNVRLPIAIPAGGEDRERRQHRLLAVRARRGPQPQMPTARKAHFGRSKVTTYAICCRFLPTSIWGFIIPACKDHSLGGQRSLSEFSGEGFEGQGKQETHRTLQQDPRLAGPEI